MASSSCAFAATPRALAEDEWLALAATAAGRLPTGDAAGEALAFSPDGKFLYVNEPVSTTAPHTELAPTRIRRIRL